MHNLLDLFKTLSLGEGAQQSGLNKGKITQARETSSTQISYFVLNGTFHTIGFDVRNMIFNVLSDNELDNNPSAVFFQNSLIESMSQTLRQFFKEKNQALLVYSLAVCGLFRQGDFASQGSKHRRTRS